MAASVVGGIVRTSHILAQVLDFSNDDDEELHVAKVVATPQQATSTREVTLVREEEGSKGVPLPSNRARKASLVRPFHYVKVGGNMPKNIPVVTNGKTQLTEEWLTNVFRFRGTIPAAARVVKMKKTRIGEGQGEFGDLYALEITEVENDDGKCPRYLIAKICPQVKSTGARLGLQACHTQHESPQCDIRLHHPSAACSFLVHSVA